MLKSSFFSVIILTSVFAMTGCERITSRPTSRPVPSFVQETEDLRELARCCGVPEDRVRSANAMTLISEIKIKIDNPTKFHGVMLSAPEKKDLSEYLSDNPSLIQKIEAYDTFIRQLNGRKIVIVE